MIALLVFWPIAGDVPALAALAVVAAVFVALIAYEAIRYRVPRSADPAWRDSHGGDDGPSSSRQSESMTGYALLPSRQSAT